MNNIDIKNNNLSLILPLVKNKTLLNLDNKFVLSTFSDLMFSGLIVVTVTGNVADEIKNSLKYRLENLDFGQVIDLKGNNSAYGKPGMWKVSILENNLATDISVNMTKELKENGIVDFEIQLKTLTVSNKKIITVSFKDILGETLPEDFSEPSWKLIDVTNPSNIPTLLGKNSVYYKTEDMNVNDNYEINIAESNQLPYYVLDNIQFDSGVSSKFKLDNDPNIKSNLDIYVISNEDKKIITITVIATSGDINLAEAKKQTFSVVNVTRTTDSKTAYMDRHRSGEVGTFNNNEISSQDLYRIELGNVSGSIQYKYYFNGIVFNPDSGKCDTTFTLDKLYNNLIVEARLQ